MTYLLNPARKPEPWVGLLEVEQGSYRARTTNLVLVDLHLMRDLFAEASSEPAAFQQLRDAHELILGIISISHEHGRGTCGDVWSVTGSFTRRGWGPLLYDAALDYVNRTGGEGLMPDRQMISESAERLWLYYARKRRDVGSRRATHPGCPTYAVPYLDRVYFADPSFRHGPFRDMRRRFRATIEELGLPEPKVEHAVMTAADDFYEDGMGAGGIMRKTISAVEGRAR